MTIFLKWKKKIISALLCACFVIEVWCFSPDILVKEQVMAQEMPSMYSGSYALMDGSTGRLLVGKEAQTPMANASTTKILTGIVTLENCSLDETVIVSANAANQPKVRYNIKEGEQYVLKELVYGLMLESYNDCAVAIAEHVAGSVEAFAEMLNEKAKEIGCRDTYFITPNGLDAENENGFHHTTAEDLCRIMSYCVWESPQKDLFLEITRTKTYGPFVNRNAFLDQMEGVLSGKTGFTAKAGYCYVAALEQNGERYSIALLACGWPNNKTYKWHDAKNLFSYGLEHYDKRTFQLFDAVKGENAQKQEPEELFENHWVEEMQVEGFVNRPEFSSINKSGTLTMSVENRSYELLMSAKEQLRNERILYENTALPIKEGDVLGKYILYLGEEKIDTIPIKAKDSANVWDFRTVLKTVFFQFFLFST